MAGMWMRALAVMTVFAAPATRDQDDAKLIEGRWKAVQIEVGGVASRGSQNGIAFKDGSFRWDNGAGSGTYVLDPSNGTVDYTDAKPDGTQGPKYFGLYEVNTNRFRDCFRRPGQKRPQLMRTRRGDGVTCIDYVREPKPEETPSPEEPGSI